MAIIDSFVNWGLEWTADFAQKRFNSAYRPAIRLRALVRGHELELPQLLRLVPPEWRWRASTFVDDKAILDAMSSVQITWLAERFGVRQEWLEGSDDRIYKRLWGYKDIGRLFELLQTDDLLNCDLRMTLFVPGNHVFDDSLGANTLGAIVFSAPFSEKDGESCRRHIVCGDAWNWGHWPGRRDLKAMARWLYQTFHTSIPIVPVPAKNVEAIRDGMEIPGPFVPNGVGTFLRLEDFALTEAESKIARAPVEAHAVASHATNEFARLVA